jgi:predicted ester cyclase
VTTAVRAAVLAYLDALNAGDPDRIAACVTDDFHNEHTSALGRSLRGRRAYRERLPTFLGQFAGLRYEVEDLLVDGERAAVAYRLSCRWRPADGATGEGATGDGTSGDEVPGVPVTIRGMFRFRVVDGAIAHRVDYWDGAEFQRQISLPRDTGATR